MKKLLIIILFLLPIVLCSFIFKNKTIFYNNTIIVHLVDKDLYLDLDDYITGVVAAEMPALFQIEALKSQAVASRSYALNKINNNMVSISSTINDQVYLTNYELKEKWGKDFEIYYNKIRECVIFTQDQVIKKDNKVLKTYYFSMSNGFTENSSTVFKEETFTSVESPYETEELKNFKVTSEFSSEDLKNKLNVKDIDITNIIKNNTNHVDSITINGKTYTGVEFRKILGLRSTDFEITSNGNKYLITTKGYGHGVGMSQYGANEMAKRGKNYQEILKYYYQGTEIVNI